MNILEIKKLWVHFQKFSVVRGVSLAIKSGEFVALIGNSGSGKSTIAHAILGLQNNARYDGQIYFKRQNLLALSEDKLCHIRGSKIAMIFQEPMTSLNPLHTIGKQIKEVLHLHGFSTDKNTNGGICLSASTGWTYQVNPNLALLLSVSAEWQNTQTEITEIIDNQEYKNNVGCNFITIGATIGIQF